jgi:aspartyl-tRNA(Asn)/glutamyl-tRNA(Gln) amidotransferase subunit A
MSEVYFARISTVARSIQNKEISIPELVRGILERIEKHDPKLNAYIRVMPDEAMKQAELLQQEVMAGHIRSPLHGIPISIKDILQTKGQITTSGSKVFAEWVPDEDATVVKKLKEAGAIIIGKANLHEFAMGATTENPHYGPARNPWDLTKIPGGSSGGSAITVAAGLAYGSIATDTAGSIRLPAAMCGVAGIKPTYGLVSRHGCTPFSWSLDHIGPMARYVRDVAALLQVIAGYDAKDPASAKREADLDMGEPLPDLKGVRLAVCREHFFEDLDAEVQDRVEKAIDHLRQLGAEVSEIELPGLADALNAQKLIAQSEVVAFHQPILRKYAHWYGEDLQFRFNFGKNVSAVEYINAQRTRRKFISRTLEVLAPFDALVAPTNSRPPFEIGTVPPEEAINNMFRLAKSPAANILGFPSLTVPCGFLTGNLPVGLQLIGKPFAEKKLLLIGEVYESNNRWADRLSENEAWK